MSDKFQWEYLKVKGEWGADKVEAGWSNSITENLSTLTVTFSNDENGTILRWQLQKIAENLNKAAKNDGLDDTGVGQLVKEYDWKIKQAVKEAREHWYEDVRCLIDNLNIITTTLVNTNNVASQKKEKGRLSHLFDPIMDMRYPHR